MTPGGASDDQSPSHPVTEAAVARWHGQSLSGRGAGSLRAAELSRARAAVTEMWTGIKNSIINTNTSNSVFVG